MDLRLKVYGRTMAQRRLMGDECVPKWNFLQVVKEQEVKCTLQARLEFICFSGGVESRSEGGEMVRWPWGRRIYV